MNDDRSLAGNADSLTGLAREELTDVPSVVDRLERITAVAEALQPLGEKDGMACFARLYHQITQDVLKSYQDHSRFGCVDHGKFKFRIRRPARNQIANVVVSVNGKRVRKLSGAAARADWITVRKLGRHARYRVHIVAFTKKGDRYSATRRYKRCG